MASVTIVALPASEEPVWKLSSEKKPHLTILHMRGSMDTDLLEIIQFVKHAAETSLSPFGLSVDRRGPLGPDDADVLFFDTQFGIPQLRSFRADLLKNDQIAKTYVASDPQYPGWIPHLTMGYPDRPATDPQEGNEHVLRWINFDRIAVWTGDSEGPEFDLPDVQFGDIDERYWSEPHGAYLMHYGKKGMRWGVRNDARRLGGSAALAKAKVRDDAWAAKVEANPKLGKVSAKAAREAKKLTRKLKKDYKEKGYNLKKDALARSRYDTELKNILENSLDKAAYKVHKNSPSGLSEVAIHRHPDGSITTLVQPRHNAKITKQKGRIAKRDARTAAREAKDALAQDAMYDLLDEIMHEDLESADGLYDGLEFILEVDDEGYVDDVSVENDDISMSDMDLDDFLEHYGRLGMRWGVRRPTNSSGLVEGSVDAAIKSGQTPVTEKGRKGKLSSDHKKMVKNLNKGVETLSTSELKEITQRIKAINDFKATTEAQKAAKASFGRKLVRWATDAAVSGAKSKGEAYIKELTGETLESLLPKTKTAQAKTKKEAQAQEDRDRKNRREDEERAAKKTSTASETPSAPKVSNPDPTPPTRSPERQLALDQLVYEITTLPKKGG